jgi:SAM-dependent methyltransferase
MRFADAVFEILSSGMTDWHEDDAFWRAMRPALFSADRRKTVSQEIDGVIELLGIAPPDKVLDLACGSAQHAIELARRGFVVTAVDRMEGYIDAARSAVAQEGVDVELVRADMREFVRVGAFAAVVNVGTSFGYFDAAADNRRVAENVVSSLMADGRALFEMVGAEIEAKEPAKTVRGRIDGVELIEQRSLSEDRRWLERRIAVVDHRRRSEFALRHRVYGHEEITALLAEAGFASVRCYGSYRGSPYAGEAERLVVVARRGCRPASPGLPA